MNGYSGKVLRRAVALNKLLLITLSLLITQACSATNQDEHAEKAYELASNRFLETKKEYEDKIVECENLKKVIVSPEFQAINLTKEEQALSLVVLNNRAESSCQSIEAGKFSVAMSIYRTTANHYKKEPAILNNYSEDLVFGDYWRQLQLEAKYLDISEEKRVLIENIEAFKQPFFPLKTLSKLNTM